MNETPGQVVACIGVFDGVHRGHRTLIDTARSIADEAGLPLVAITFFPHPAAVLRPESVPLQIATVQDRISTPGGRRRRRRDHRLHARVRAHHPRRVHRRRPGRTHACCTRGRGGELSIRTHGRRNARRTRGGMRRPWDIGPRGAGSGRLCALVIHSNSTSGQRRGSPGSRRGSRTGVFHDRHGCSWRSSRP